MATSAAALVRLLARPRRRDRRPRRACRSRSPGSRCATSTRSATVPLPARCFTDDAGAVVGDPDVDVVVEVIGGIEPARTLILDALKARQAGRHREQGAARELRRGAVRGRRGRGRRPAVRGVGRRRHPAHPAAARVAGRRAHPPGDGHRQRHDQLRPHPHDRGGLRRSPTRSPRRRSSGYAERDPTADVEGFDAAAKAAIIASHRVRRARRRRRRLPRGHHARSPPTTSRRRASSATS